MTDKQAQATSCSVSYFQEAKMTGKHAQGKTQGRGFTLIELLVVIAIIAILAAILFPAFARARENARRASCQSNLKQIALGVFQYKQDYDEKLPLYHVSGGYYGWADRIQPYIKSTQILQCPSEPSKESSTPNADNYTDYWINIMAIGQSDASFNGPASTVLIGDGEGTNVTGAWSRGGGATECGGFATSDPIFTCANNPTTTLVKATLPPGGAHRHLTGANFAFADGHVKWQKGVSDTSDDMASVYIASNTIETTGGAPTFSIK